MKKYIKISIVVIIALIILAIIASVVFKIPTIGKVHGAENELITIKGLTYIQNTSAPYSYEDRGKFLGYVTNENTTIRVYDVKGDNDDFIYALWEWEGSIYECEKISNTETNQNTSDLVLEEPPILTVMCGKESVEALRGTSSWQYLNDNGTSTAIESDSMHPLQAKEYMTPLKLIPTQYSHVEPFKAYLQWDVAPDWVVVRYWSEESWGEIVAESEMVPVLMMDSDTDIGPIFPMDLQKGNYIYEVIAEWNNYDKFSGKAHYSFYTANYYDIEFNDLQPIPQSE